MPLAPLTPRHPFLRLPPQIARHPQLHAPAAAGRRCDDGPRDHGPLFVLEDDEGEVRGGPADGLEGDEADEGGEGRVVDAPAGEEAGGEGEALVAGEDGLGGCVSEWRRKGEKRGRGGKEGRTHKADTK